MRRLFCFGLVAAGFVHLGVAAPDTDVRLLAGTWRYDPSRSTDLSGWQTLQLVITADEPRVTITWQYGAGRRTYEDVIPLDLSKSVNLVPSNYWASNRHIGAYMGGDKTRKYKFRVLNNGRLLRTSADFTLATQQGEYSVNVLREYKASSNGQELTLTELRTSRDDPIIFIFQRVPDGAAATPAPKG